MTCRRTRNALEWRQNSFQARCSRQENQDSALISDACIQDQAASACSSTSKPCLTGRSLEGTVAADPNSQARSTDLTACFPQEVEGPSCVEPHSGTAIPQISTIHSQRHSRL